jgi:hypothetical protein
MMVANCPVCEGTDVASVFGCARHLRNSRCELEFRHLVSMHPFMAFGTQRDQVLFLVATRLAA